MYNFFYIFFVSLCFSQNISAPVINIFYPELVIPFLILKEVLIIMLAVFGIIYAIKYKIYSLMSIYSLGYIVFCAASWKYSGMISPLSLRQLMILPLVLLASGYKTNKNFNFNLCNKYLTTVLTVIVISTFIEFLVFHLYGNYFWHAIQYSHFIHDKGLGSWLGAHGVPRGWYTWDTLFLD